MENLRKDDGRKYLTYLMGILFGRGFCDISTRNKDLVYAVFQKEMFCGEFNSRTSPFDGENRLTVILPLYDDNEKWHHGICTYRRNPPVTLPKGKYFTGFTYTFEYPVLPEWDGKDVNSIPSEESIVEVGPVTMKIDFTIE